MADGKRQARICFDLAALPDGPFRTIIDRLGVQDKIRLQSVSKALLDAFRYPQIPDLWGHLIIELDEYVLTRNGTQEFLHGGAFKLVDWITDRIEGIKYLYLKCSMDDVAPTAVLAATATGWQSEAAAAMRMHAFLHTALPALLLDCQGWGRWGLRLRCDSGNPFACGLFAVDGPEREALSEVLMGLTIANYTWTVTDQQFEALCCFQHLRQLIIETRMPRRQWEISNRRHTKGAEIGASAIPDHISILTALKMLSLEGHPNLAKLPPALYSLPALQILHLSYTSLEELPSCLSRLTRLETISVTSTCSGKMTVAPDALNGPALQECRLGFMSDVAATDIRAASLQSLLLEGCSGTVTFGALPALRKLELTSRRVPIPDSVARLTALQKLDLREHFLSELPQAIGDLVSLRKLDLRCNRLAAVPGLISRLRALEHLNMSSQYELQSRAPFDLSSLALLHGLAALSFVALV